MSSLNVRVEKLERATVDTSFGLAVIYDVNRPHGWELRPQAKIDADVEAARAAGLDVVLVCFVNGTSDGRGAGCGDEWID